MKPFVHTFTDEQSWIEQSKLEILRDIDTQANFRLAFSGGSSPAPVYRKLAEDRTVNWQNADVYLVDERFMPPTDPDSNQRLIRENFPVPATFHFWETENIQHQESAEKYDLLLKDLVLPINTVVLGVGPDGHTASLFPNSPALSETKKAATIATTDVFAVQERLTMTFPLLLAADKLVILIKGAAKKPVVDELLNGDLDFEKFPSKKLLEHGNLHLYYGEF